MARCIGVSLAPGLPGALIARFFRNNFLAAVQLPKRNRPVCIKRNEQWTAKRAPGSIAIASGEDAPISAKFSAFRFVSSVTLAVKRVSDQKAMDRTAATL
jgi:hypothetical protein